MTDLWMERQQQIRDALLDMAYGFDSAEVRNVSGLDLDPVVADSLRQNARRIASRVSPTDERLLAFDRFSDSSGYPWIPQTAVPLLSQAATEAWSFERWFTALADFLNSTEPPTAEDLEELRVTANDTVGMYQSGYRLVSARPGGLLFRRAGDA